MGIHIEINKDFGINGNVTIYTSMTHGIGIVESQRFRDALSGAIGVAIKWQEGNFFREPRPDTESASDASGRSKSGKARAASLSPDRRTEIARNAANTRWQKGDAAATETAS